MGPSNAFGQSVSLSNHQVKPQPQLLLFNLLGNTVRENFHIIGIVGAWEYVLKHRTRLEAIIILPSHRHWDINLTDTDYQVELK